MIRKHYTEEFKLDAVSLVTEQKYSRAEAARNLGIDARLLGRWVREHQSEGGQAFRGNGQLSEEQAQIRALKAQVKRLEMERSILKNHSPGTPGLVWTETRVSARLGTLPGPRPLAYW